MEGVSLEISGDTICGAITVNVDMLVNVLQGNGTNKPCGNVIFSVCFHNSHTENDITAWLLCDRQISKFWEYKT